MRDGLDRGYEREITFEINSDNASKERIPLLFPIYSVESE